MHRRLQTYPSQPSPAQPGILMLATAAAAAAALTSIVSLHKILSCASLGHFSRLFLFLLPLLSPIASIRLDLTSPHLTSPHLTSPPLTSPHLPSTSSSFLLRPVCLCVCRLSNVNGRGRQQRKLSNSRYIQACIWWNKDISGATSRTRFPRDNHPTISTPHLSHEPASTVTGHIADSATRATYLHRCTSGSDKSARH
ncbi:uncharacterized protein LY89DRAFT_387569 [Mollisia scopiformis]|uniref:Uncharacterized protein n=1 Tax=Mollisia scopiformis TaxID=149040 RepID=A0A194XNT4_MOLSC|nr:uncharacterized protein LY89DRAFT_387569 [Mollisia scopiformis]KUJ21895.1 hypothetical protein LY89DRAFT_387569 [Mollisia scopiformis]